MTDAVERLRAWASQHSNVTPLDGTDRDSPTFGDLRELLALAAPSEKDAELSDVLTFLTANRETHRKWAEWFEAYPDKEAEYVATGEWDGAVEQRRLETGYTRAIELLDRLATLTGPGEAKWQPMSLVPKHGRRIYLLERGGKASVGYANPELGRSLYLAWWPLPEHRRGAAMQSSSPPPKEAK